LLGMWREPLTHRFSINSFFIPFRLPKIRHFKANKKGLKFSPCITITFPLKPRKEALKQAQ
jgi:hypothetical protein